MAIFLICGFFTIYFALGHYLFAFALDGAFAFSTLTPEGYEIENNQPKTNEVWFNSVTKEVVKMPSYDGYMLSAYSIKNTSNNWVILVHGYRGSAQDMTFYASKYYEQGFNILLPDLKGHGESEGRYIGMGLGDSKDITLWANKLTSENPNVNIILHGISMGAASVMLATGEKLPSTIKGAVADSGYSSAYEQFSYLSRELLHMPFTPLLLSSVNMYAKRNTGISLKDISPEKALSRSTTPTLFIHGDKDDFVPFYMLEKVYEAHKDPSKEKLIIHGATHVYSATIAEEEYFRRVFNFCDKYI